MKQLKWSKKNCTTVFIWSAGVSQNIFSATPVWDAGSPFKVTKMLCLGSVNHFYCLLFCLFFIFFCDLQKARRHSSVNYNAQFLSVTLSDPKKRNIFKLNYFSGYQIILAGFEWNTTYFMSLFQEKTLFKKLCLHSYIFLTHKKMSLTTEKKSLKNPQKAVK